MHGAPCLPVAASWAVGRFVRALPDRSPARTPTIQCRASAGASWPFGDAVREPHRSAHAHRLPECEMNANAPYQIWGRDLEEQAVQQMSNACTLPVAISGALM